MTEDITTSRRTHFELRAARKTLALTQAEMAKIFHRNVKSIKNWESGRHMIPHYVWPTLSTLYALAEISDEYEDCLDKLQTPPHETIASILHGEPERFHISPEVVIRPERHESFKQLAKLFHPDVRANQFSFDPGAEMTILNHIRKAQSQARGATR
jgi:transcriptional regulator with XRE-family HTH domain